MDLARHFYQLLNYDEWANKEMIDSFRRAGNPPARSVKLLAHVVSAEYVWLTRLTTQPQPFQVWPEFNVEECATRVSEIASLWKSYFDQQLPTVLELDVRYTNSKGESWNSTVRDILTHVFMHSAYHRGQIAADMREHGHTPAYTDFIHGVRLGLVE